MNTASDDVLAQSGSGNETMHPRLLSVCVQFTVTAPVRNMHSFTTRHHFLIFVAGIGSTHLLYKNQPRVCWCMLAQVMVESRLFSYGVLDEKDDLDEVRLIRPYVRRFTVYDYLH